MSRSHLWFGRNSTGKTKAALDGATPDHPVSYHELEYNGFKRGSNRLHLDEGAVLVVRDRVVAGVGVLPQLEYRLEGWAELIAEFNANYKADCSKGYRPVVDTATRLWLAQRNAFEQQVQNAASKAAADALGQLRYTAPNSRMIGAATHGLEYFDLDTILIAHEDTIFGTTTLKADTMKEIENLVDVVLRFEWKGNGPVATFWKGAEAGQLKGKEISEPTLAKVNLIVDCAAALEHEGMGMPESVEDILMQGRLLGVK